MHRQAATSDKPTMLLLQEQTALPQVAYTSAKLTTHASMPTLEYQLVLL